MPKPGTLIKVGIVAFIVVGMKTHGNLFWATGVFMVFFLCAIAIGVIEIIEAWRRFRDY